MDANRFFSIPYDNRNDVKMRRLRKRLGGYEGYGRWVALLGMLYDEHGILDMTDREMQEIVAEELDLEDVDEFFIELGKLGLIDEEVYRSLGHVVNHGVCDEVEYRRKKSEAGKKGMAKRWNKKKE